MNLKTNAETYEEKFQRKNNTDEEAFEDRVSNVSSALMNLEKEDLMKKHMKNSEKAQKNSEKEE